MPPTQVFNSNSGINFYENLHGMRELKRLITTTCPCSLASRS